MLRLTEWTAVGVGVTGVGILVVALCRRLLLTGSVGRRWGRRIGTALGGLVVVCGLLVTGWAVVTANGDRDPRTVVLGPGVTYERVAFEDPRPQVFHLAVVDLDEPCLSLDTTRPDPDGAVTAETGAEFLARTGALLSINVAYFYPIREYPPWEAYPRSGDPVTAIGRVVVDGRSYGVRADAPLDRALTVVDGRASAGADRSGAEFMVPAREVLVADGRVVAPESTPYPRAVAGVDLDTNQLVLLVADGKQPGYAEGSTYDEVARFLVERGVDEAVEFDGGGSATLVGRVDGKVDVLSRPSQQRLPGRLRPVATHLGIHLDPACS